MENPSLHDSGLPCRGWSSPSGDMVFGVRELILVSRDSSAPIATSARGLSPQFN